MTSEGHTVRVLLGDGNVRRRRVSCGALVNEPGVEVVAEVADEQEMLTALERRRPDVAVLDAGLPTRGGVEACASIKADHNRTRVLVVSGGPDPTLLLEAVEAGADGYLDRSADVGQLVRAVRSVHAGEAWIPSDMLGILLRRLIQRQRQEDEVLGRFFRLSRREKEIFFLIADGLDKQAIATALVVSQNTARTHIQNVLYKLELHSRQEVIDMANEHRLPERFCVGT